VRGCFLPQFPPAEQSFFQICSECTEPTLAQSLCTLCNKWLCYQCTDVHQHQRASSQYADSFSLKNRLAARNKTGSPGSYPCSLLMCHTHRQEPLELFCESCDLLCCSSCHLSSHKNHRVVQIGKALQDQQWLFENLMVQVEERRSSVENSAKQIEDRLHGVKIAHRKAENQIKMAKMIMMNELNKRANLLIEQLEKISEEFQQRLEDQLQGAIEICGQLDHIQKFITWATTHHCRGPVLFSRALISLQMQQLLESSLHTDSWSPVKLKFNWDASYWTKQISSFAGQLIVDGGNCAYPSGLACSSILRPQPVACLALPAMFHRGREPGCGYQTCCEPQICCLHGMPPQQELATLDKSQMESTLFNSSCAQPAHFPASLHQSQQLQRFWETESSLQCPPPTSPLPAPIQLGCSQGSASQDAQPLTYVSCHQRQREIAPDSQTHLSADRGGLGQCKAKLSTSPALQQEVSHNVRDKDEERCRGETRGQSAEDESRELDEDLEAGRGEQSLVQLQACLAADQQRTRPALNLRMDRNGKALHARIYNNTNICTCFTVLNTLKPIFVTKQTFVSRRLSTCLKLKFNLTFYSPHVKYQSKSLHSLNPASCSQGVEIRVLNDSPAFLLALSETQLRGLSVSSRGPRPWRCPPEPTSAHLMCRAAGSAPACPYTERPAAGRTNSQEAGAAKKVTPATDIITANMHSTRIHTNLKLDLKLVRKMRELLNKSLNSCFLRRLSLYLEKDVEATVEVHIYMLQRGYLLVRSSITPLGFRNQNLIDVIDWLLNFNYHIKYIIFLENTVDYFMHVREACNSLKRLNTEPRRSTDYHETASPNSGRSRVPVVCLERLKILVSQLPPHGRRQSDPLPASETEKSEGLAQHSTWHTVMQHVRQTFFSSQTDGYKFIFLKSYQNKTSDHKCLHDFCDIRSTKSEVSHFYGNDLNLKNNVQLKTSNQRKQDVDEMESEDFCAVCLIGGELLCCDRCPKVFHLSCHVPPLLSFPTGDWVCSVCRDVLQPEVEYDCENERSSAANTAHGLSACDQRKCERLALLILSNILSAPFHEPVSPLARHYYQIIKRPMDLSVIRAKLSKGNPRHYSCPDQFVADVCLMFRNCAKFNYPDSEVAQAGHSLELFFMSKLKEVFPDRDFPMAELDSDSDEYDETCRAANGSFLWPERREQCHRKRKRRQSLKSRRHHF
uniref:Tripartite motif containing 66 n=1 Tax=Poecilia formosa TaxID=48698 RepID=A0A087XQI7_POEFO